MKKTIIVVGGGTTGALVCGSLTTINCDIINIRNSKLPTIGVGESTIPLVMTAIQHMGIATEFVEKTNCWPKHGSIFKGWSDKTVTAGWAINGHRNDVITHLEGLTRNKKINAGVYMMENGLYPYDKDTDSFYSPISIHLDANDTSEFIFNKFKNKITTIHGDITDVKIGPSGIQSVTIDSENTVSGGQDTYWIDATGFNRLLINSLGSKFIKSELPCNGAVFKKIEDINYEENWANRSKDMMTTSTTGDAGWFWNIPLKRGRGRGYVYSRDFLSEDEAAREFGDTEVSFLKYEPGWLQTPAIKNCYAVGLAAGFLDPLDSPSIGQTVSQIFKFMYGLENPNPQRYSEEISDRFSRLEKYLLIHYRTCNRVSPFWNSIDKFKKKDLVSKYIESIKDENWGYDFHGFLLSQTCRVIQNKIDMGADTASLIYETIPEEERSSIKEDYNRVKNKYVPWTKDIFMKHIETKPSNMNS